MRKFVFGLTAALVTVGTAFTASLVAQAADTFVEERVEQGRPVVLDSWMEPAVVRTREVKNEDGNSVVLHEPLIMERHERVVLPTSETKTTTTVHPPQKRIVEKSAVVTKKARISKKKKARVAHHRKAKKRHVAYSKKRKPPAGRLVAQKTVEAETRPAVIEQTQQTVQRDIIFERRHPALDLY